MSASDAILKQVKDLSVEEQLELGYQISNMAVQTVESELDDASRAKIDSILAERINGPFAPFSKNWKQDILRRATAKRNA
ncbi:hypothetical protein N8737_03320 [Verrucomicrobia bacterium]|jgi:hypothetical protein|nr:hypothetical protein [Verrucomicrobiota bacterium]